MFCSPPAAVVSVRHANGAAHVNVGIVRLANGALFELADWGDDPSVTFGRVLRLGDRVEICYAPAQRWADEPANARMALVVDDTASKTHGATYVYTVAVPPPRRT